ncbi:MAG: hypothetical protein RL095_1311 [Verrucomicrobiota bacterium]|jgi:predicted oxidoreductase
MIESLVDAAPRRIGAFHEVSAFGFGCWRFLPHLVPDPEGLLASACDGGVNLIDTADVYGYDWGGTGFGEAEKFLGRCFAASPSLRDRFLLCGKSGIRPGTPYDSSRIYLRQAIEASLRRLRTDRLDLFLVHRPDFFTHPADLAATLVEFRDLGLIREAGVSNFLPAQVDALQSFLPFPLAVLQTQFSAYRLSPLHDGQFDFCQSRNLLPLAWSPLDGGRLGDDAVAVPGGPSQQLLDALDLLARREGLCRSAIALAFVLAHPARPVALLGSTRTERLQGLLSAARARLDRADLYGIVGCAMNLP